MTTTTDATSAPPAGSTAPRLKQKYADEIKANLQQQLGLGNVMQVPALSKIVINMGVGRPPSSPRCSRVPSPTSR
jgi:large subunit ribosomal protein L5